MGDNDFFQFTRIDVVSAAKDHVFFTIDDGEISVSVHNADVTGVKPTVAESLSRSFGTFVVAFHYVMSANYDLASLSSRNFRFVIINTFDLGTHQRLADCSGFCRTRQMIKTSERRSLGQSVALTHTNSK